MSSPSGWLRQQAVRILALALLVALYGFTRLPHLSPAEREELAARFSFEAATLPELPGVPQKSTREVSPSLANISGWISTVGAAVALADVDGDGLPNDLCHVDPRVDRAIVSPVPGTGARYAPFALDAAPLPYDAATMAPMGCLPGDYNEDGRLDLLVYYWGRTPVVFLHRDAGAGPELGRPALAAYRPVEVLANGERWYTNAATRADLDGDGHADLVLGNYFEDGARILDRRSTTPEHMHAAMSRATNGGKDRLLLWSGATAGAEPAVRFAEQDVLEPEVANGWTLALAAADFDGDLLPELYFGHDFGPDRMLHNRSRPGHLRFARIEGRRGFTTPASKVLGHDSFKGMGVDFGDVDGDGRLDIYVSNIADEFALEESHFVFVGTGDPAKVRDEMLRGIAPFSDRSEPLGLSRSGWGWEARLADFDNDGMLEALQATGFLRGATNRWPELHELAMGNDHMLASPRDWPLFQPGDDLSGSNRNPFFVRAASGRYFDLAAEVGFTGSHVSRGIATADVDGDGDLDLVVANQWEPSVFYRNDSPRSGAALDLALRLATGSPAGAAVTPLSPGALGTVASWPAIGAAATVHLPDGRVLVGQVDGGNGHSGKRSPDLHFGLGRLPAGSTLPVDLAWRDTAGRVHRQTVRLTAGRHTLLLAGPQGKES